MFICDANQLADTRTLFLLKDYGVFILVAIVLSFPIIPWLEKRWKTNEKVYNVVQTICMCVVALLFTWSLSFVVELNNLVAYANF